MRAAAGLVIAVAAAMAMFEITMSPSPEDRGRLLVLFVAVDGHRRRVAREGIHRRQRAG